MKDIELTKKVAEKCGLTYVVEEDEVIISPCVFFDPLHNFNDLMTIVVPRLPSGWTLTYNAEFQNYYLYNLRNRVGRRLSLDMPRAVCECLVEADDDR